MKARLPQQQSTQESVQKVHKGINRTRALTTDTTVPRVTSETLAWIPGLRYRGP